MARSAAGAVMERAGRTTPQGVVALARHSFQLLARLTPRSFSKALREHLFAAVFVFAWAVHYLSGVRRIQLHRGRGGTVCSPKAVRAAHERLRSVLRRCPSLQAVYWPTWFAHTSWLQFVLLGLKEIRGRVLPRPYARQVLTLRDGCQIALDWIHPAASARQPGQQLRKPEAESLKQDGPPVCILLHGAVQDSASVTMIEPARSLASSYGMPVVVMNRRGYGGLDPASTAQPRLDMFGFDEDLDDVLQEVGNRYPGRHVAIVGFSCGSGFAARYVGNRGHRSVWQSDDVGNMGSLPDPPFAARRQGPRLLCAVFYDPGYDVSLDGAVSRIQFPYNWVLNWAIKYTYGFRHRTSLRAKSPSMADMVSSVVSLRNGLKDTYRATRRLSRVGDSSAWLDSQQAKFDDITIPSLVINSRDDPICVWGNVEEIYAELCANPNVVLADLARGSHGCKFDFWGWRSIVDGLIGDFVLAASCELRERRAATS